MDKSGRYQGLTPDFKPRDVTEIRVKDVFSVVEDDTVLSDLCGSARVFRLAGGDTGSLVQIDREGHSASVSVCEFHRRPKSKKARIVKKWLKRQENWRYTKLRTVVLGWG